MIVGEKIKIRRIRSEDLPRILGWINDAQTAYYMGIKRPVTLKLQRHWFENFKRDKTKKVFAILERTGGKHIGNISIDNISLRDKNARLAIFIGEKNFRRMGYAYEAMLVFLEYCFNKLRLHKIFLIVHEDNVRAIKLYKKCGFTREGLLRQHERYRGKFINKIVMGVLKAEFLKKQGCCSD